MSLLLKIALDRSLLFTQPLARPVADIGDLNERRLAAVRSAIQDVCELGGFGSPLAINLLLFNQFSDAYDWRKRFAKVSEFLQFDDNERLVVFSAANIMDPITTIVSVTSKNMSRIDNDRAIVPPASGIVIKYYVRIIVNK